VADLPPTAIVREARADDAPALAELHVRTWQSTYVGIVPQDILDALSVKHREAHWRDRLAEPTGDRRTWLAEADGLPAGFVTAGRTRDDDLLDETPDAGEVYALYVAGWAQGRGLGGALMGAALGWLRGIGRDPIAVWVIVGNDPAIRFYERLGFRLDGARQPIDFDGTPVDEVRFRLRDG
jgi:GNAT superfamily N-acetyltransferase